MVVCNLALDFGSRKLVVVRVDRKDLPHLTFSWGNASGEVDAHLTPASPKGENDRQSILKMQESELKARFGDLLKQVWEHARKSRVLMIWGVQPRWLAEQGYVLLGPKDEPVIAWLQGALPKKRGKYRLDETRLKQFPKMARHRPTARCFELLGQQGQIYALCLKGPDRGRALALQALHCGFVSPTWLAFDLADMCRLCRALIRLLAKWLANLSPGAWDKIYDALQLRELGLQRHTAILPNKGLREGTTLAAPLP
jgi:hypothetical protein